MISTVHRNVLYQDGLYFKDIDGSGVMQDYNDWRLSSKQRAESYVKQLSVKEKTDQLFIADWRMGIYQKMGEIEKIAAAVHAKGGKVITNINITLAWQVGGVEKLADCLLAGYNTFTDATLDVILGEFNPTGRLPITLPKDDSVIAVNKDGVCISPKDVPDYEKDQYMPDEMKDENGKAYAYRDSMGNYCEMDFGLSY